MRSLGTHSGALGKITDEKNGDFSLLVDKEMCNFAALKNERGLKILL
jgi:hypothetical protein